MGMTLSFAGEKQEAIAALNKAIALSPRNPMYSGNLASAYLQAQDFDHAIPLLQELQKSSEPGIAAMAAQQLQQVEACRSAISQRDPRSSKPETAGQPLELRQVPEDAEAPAASGNNASERRTVSGSTEPVLFMKGVLVSIDCSNAPAATLTLSSGGKKWKMLAPQAKKLILMGAEEFSCSWTNRKVAVNYRKSGNDQGDLVSLELE